MDPWGLVAGAIAIALLLVFTLVRYVQRSRRQSDRRG